MAWPNVLIMFAQAATGLIETYWVGMLGTDALAGMALVFPGVMLMQMISAGAMGGGISSAIARALGAGKRDDAIEPVERRLCGLKPHRGAKIIEARIDRLAPRQPFDDGGRSVAQPVARNQNARTPIGFDRVADDQHIAGGGGDDVAELRPHLLFGKRIEIVGLEIAGRCRESATHVLVLRRHVHSIIGAAQKVRRGASDRRGPMAQGRDD